MSGPESPRPPRRRIRGVGSWALLAALGGLFGYLSDLPYHEGMLMVLGGVLVGGALQRLGPSAVRTWAPVPVVAGFGLTSVASPLGLVPELLAGGGGLAILVWLADDPGRPAGGVRRARNTLALPALALGIAGVSALLLPSHSAPLGVAVGLMVFVVATVAYLVGRPALLDREGPPRS